MTNDDLVEHAAAAPDTDVVIRNCNNIDEARISLRRGSLNIKYGQNGIGKSTIARALELHSQGEDALLALLPFKYRESGAASRPELAGADDIQRVLVFNDTYVSQFVFQSDEVVKNSFEIFINTPEFQEGNAQIEAIFEILKQLFLENESLDDVIASFAELRTAFSVTRSGAISKSSRGYKALRMGGKLDAVPEALRGFELFLKGDDPAGWVTWQAKGQAFLDVSENCPFCSVPNFDKATARKVSEEYESAAVKNMSALRGVIERLRGSFDPDYFQKLLDITATLDELSPEQEQFLAGMRGQIETLLGKFTALKSLSFTALRDVDDVDGVLKELKIDLSLLPALDSVATQGVVAKVNQELDAVADQINEIRARVGMQKKRVKDLIRENQAEINEFLSSAGYRYVVRIEPNEDSYRMILEHNDAAGHLESASAHLSYGEKNAFALVLFMHHVRREAPDLVVLDDPVSSFDKTKKFAILHKLFHGANSIRDFTTLLLTHDIEPAIDVIRIATSGQFQAALPVAHFLSCRDGRVTEKEILRSDLITFSQVCDQNIASATDAIIRCIYLRRRYEVHGKLGVEYELISSLLHLREAPDQQGEDGHRVPLTQDEIDRATEAIREFIEDFEYARILTEVRDLESLKTKFDATSVGYEKVQIFRIALEHDASAGRGEAAFKKFVNETFHIENEYVMQLNPRDFDAVPEHVVASCAAFFEQLS